jgi:dTDP-4-dehydrorhamnose 3,5-epimerase
MSRFSISDTPLVGLKRVQRNRLQDERGFLSRLFCADELHAAGWYGSVAQINHTCTQQLGTVRGLHYQKPPHVEIKLVSCLRGRVWDVAVDLRPDSPTFLRWHPEELSGDNGCALLIPQGFAHGFQVMEVGSELLYCHSAAYAPQAEGGLNPLDPRLAITWPLPVQNLSPRDSGHPMISDDFEGVRL